MPARARLLSSSVLGALFGELARDVTVESSRRSCLVLAPHPDDETLACGATMARKLEAGSEVYVVVMTDGATWPPDRPPAVNAAVRAAELHRAMAVIGLPEAAVVHHGLPDANSDADRESVSEAVSDAVRRFGPDEVYSASMSDGHPDHAALGRAARRVLAGTSVRLFEYPIWQWEHPGAWIRTLSTTGRPQAVSTAGFLEQKQAALRHYVSQVSMSGAEQSPYTMAPGLVQHFLRLNEIFFPVRA